nr:hypothetical protein [Tanacetum cinerariifolium]
MSDLKDFTVTYTVVSSLFRGLSDIGSLGVEGPPMMPEDPYAYPLPAADSPTADSPGYILESGLEKDPDEDEEDPDEDPANYPADRDDDDEEEKEEEESSRDETDNVKEDEDKDEEEEHPAPADSIPPPPVNRVTARMSIREQPPTQVCSEVEIDRLLAIPSPSPSPLSPCPTYPLGYRAAMIRLKAETPSTSHPLSSSTPPSGTPPLLPIPLPTSSPPLLLPSTSHRAYVLEVTLPPWNRLCIALRPRYEVGESSSAAAARPTGGFRADYGFVATLDDEIRRDPEREVGYGITNTWDEMLVGMTGAPDDRALISKRVNMLYRDRRDHALTARLMETEARLSHQAWVQSMDASDLARSEVMALRTQVVAQHSEIMKLRVEDRMRQVQFIAEDTTDPDDSFAETAGTR